MAIRCDYRARGWACLCRVILLAHVLMAALALTRSARAEEPVTLVPPSPRQGYYLTLGLYNLLSHATESGDSLGTWSGGGYALRLGQMLTQRLGLGIALDFGVTEGKGLGRDQMASFFGLSIEGQWTPIERLSILGGTGLGAMQLAYKTLMPDEPDELRGNFGMYLLLGASYDFFPYKRELSGGLALSPSVRLRYLPGDTASGIVIFLGVDISWWTGVPKNQLELPLDRAF